jgi:hypothetical protein
MRTSSLFAIGALATLSIVGFSSASIAGEEKSAVDASSKAVISEQSVASASGSSLVTDEEKIKGISNDGVAVSAGVKDSSFKAQSANKSRSFIRARY